MQQINSSFDREFEFVPSRVLIGLTIAITLLALVALWVLQSPVLIKVTLMICLLYVSYITLQGLALLSTNAVVALRSNYAERAWILTLRSGIRFKAVQQDCKVFRHLVMLSVRDVVGGRKRTILVASDALAHEKHRQLRALVLSLGESA